MRTSALAPPSDDASALGGSEAVAAALRLLSYAYVVHAADGTVIDYNETAANLLGLSHDELMGLTSLDPRWQAIDERGDPVPGEEHPAMVTLRTRHSVDRYRMGVRRADQRLVWLEISSRLVHPDEPTSECVVVFTDVTKEVARERALNTIRSINGSLTSAQDVGTLLLNTCRALVDGGGYSLAWVGVAHDHDAAIDVRACWGATAYLDDAVVTWSADEATGRGPVGTAIRDGVTTVINDVTTDVTFTPWRELAIGHGLAGVAALPLTVEGRPAALAVYTHAAEAFDSDAMSLLEALVRGVGYGLTNLERTARLEWSLEATIATLARTAETRDPYTAGHQYRVGELSVAIAEAMGLDGDTCKGIRLGAHVHDIGKIAIPAEMLSKPGRLDEIEYQLIQRHSAVGARILSDGRLPWPVPEIAAQHHERWDGSGYPDGLRGTEISLPARIVAVADVVEAVAHHRPYRAGRGVETALQIVRDGAGTDFDPDVAVACQRVFDAGFAFSPSEITPMLVPPPLFDG